MAGEAAGSRRLDNRLIYLLILVIALIVFAVRWWPQPLGHLQPFGQSSSNVMVDRIDGFPTTYDFLHDYAIDSRPVLMAGAIRKSRSFLRWTDKYLHNLADKEPTYVMFEPMKKEIRNNFFAFKSLQKFLDVYNSSDIYIVDTIPESMTPDVFLPCPLQVIYFNMLDV